MQNHANVMGAIVYEDQALEIFIALLLWKIVINTIT